MYPTSVSRPQAQFALATYLPEVSSPVDWHGPEDCELKGKGGGRSGTVLGRQAGGTSLPSQVTSPGPANRWRKEAHRALTLTDFAIDSHLQPQALVFLVVDGFGCKTNPHRALREEPLLGENTSANPLALLSQALLT